MTLPQADLVRVLTRDLHGHVVVQDLDRQVLALLPQHLARLLLDDCACAVVRIHHLVADLVQADLPLLIAFTKRAGGVSRRPENTTIIAKIAVKRRSSVFEALEGGLPAGATAGGSARRGCAPGAAAGPRGSRARGRNRRPPPPRARAARRGRSTRAPSRSRDDPPDHAVGQPRDVREDAEAARRDAVVERVHGRAGSRAARRAGRTRAGRGSGSARQPSSVSASPRRRADLVVADDRVRARPGRLRRAPRAASGSGGPRCRARRSRARSRSAIRVVISARWRTTSTSSSMTAFWNSSAVSRVSTCSSRCRYVSSVATAWFVFASTSAIGSSW